MAAKRPSNNSPASSQKKQKKSRTVALFEKVIEQADVVLELILPLQGVLEMMKPDESAQCLDVLIKWKLACGMAKVDKITWPLEELALLDVRLPDTCQYSPPPLN